MRHRKVLAPLLLALALRALLGAAVARGAELEPLSVTERDVDGETVLVVHNAFYEAVIRPLHGATISSLDFGVGQRAALTAWAPGTPSGLVQELHTADATFRTLKNDSDGSGAILEFEARAPSFVLRKRFEFRRDLPAFKVVITCENHSDVPLAWAEAPILSNLVLPAGGKPSGREYYCLCAEGAARTITAATVLKELHPLRPTGGGLQWLAVTDTVTRRGLGFLFLDSAARDVRAARNAQGVVTVQWGSAAAPAWSSLRSEMLVVPLDGFAGVSEMARDFVADAVPATGNGKTTVSLRLLALENDLEGVSVVTRAYGKDGAEAGLWDSLQYQTIKKGESALGELASPAGAAPAAWLQHEVYSKGRKLGQVLVQVAADAPVPVREAKELPRPAVEQLARPPEQAGGGGAQEAAQKDFVVRLFEPGGAGTPAKALKLGLTAGERETVFFEVRARAAIERMRVSLTAGEAGADAAVKALPPAATYLWWVQTDDAGAARLTPLAERPLALGETAYFALTVDASQLEPGAYSARLLAQSATEPTEVLVSVAVVKRKMPPRNSFALWFVDTGPRSETAGTMLSRLQDYGASAVSLPVDRGASAPAVTGALRSAEANHIDMVGFHSAGVETAERMAREGLPVSTLLHVVNPSWLLVAGTDSPAELEQLEKMGFCTGVLVPNLACLKDDARWRSGSPTHWIVADGCEPGAVPALVKGGRIRPDECVWLYLDLRGMDWRRAAFEVRSAFWAAAWQGLAGAVVRCEPPLGEGETQSVLWHILRDAREEAALVLVAAADAQTLAEQGDNTLSLEVGAIVGDLPVSAVEVRQDKRAFGSVLRAVPQVDEKAGLGPMSALNAARGRLLALLDATARAAKFADPGHYDLYWAGLPLRRGGSVSSAIMASGGQEQQAVASSLQKAVKQRPEGLELPLLEALPKQEGDSSGVTGRVIWLVTDGKPVDGYPEALNNAIVSVDKDGLRLVSVGGMTVVVMGTGADVAAIVRHVAFSRSGYRGAHMAR